MRCNCCTKKRFVLKAYLVLTHILGIRSKAIEHWMWSMTPIPMGFPSMRQYVGGLLFFWKVRGVGDFD